MGSEEQFTGDVSMRTSHLISMPVKLNVLFSGAMQPSTLASAIRLSRTTLLTAAQRFGPLEYLGLTLFTSHRHRIYLTLANAAPRINADAKRVTDAKRRLEMLSRYAVWVDALICTYMGERYGIKLGASFADVIKWLPAMRPYPAYDDEDNEDFIGPYTR